MNKSVIAILGVIVIVGIGWYFLNSGTDTQSPVDTQEEVTGGEIVVVLREQNGSGESGTATITETEGGVRVVLSLTGVPEGVVQPAHIHLNSCADIAGVQYPLTSSVNGSSETTLEVSMDELQGGLPLSVNVHKSAAEASVYVACGDITL